MSEELKNCPLCENEEVTVFSHEVYKKFSRIEVHCKNDDCKFFTEIYHWQNLPRLDEKRKAEIAFEMMREFSELTDDFSEGHEVADFVDWLNEKSKGER